jgi:hypothetical protein
MWRLILRNLRIRNQIFPKRIKASLMDYNNRLKKETAILKNLPFQLVKMLAINGMLGTTKRVSLKRMLLRSMLIL